MRVANPCQVIRPRLDVQFGQQPVGTRVGVCLRDAAVLIVQIAEFDRLSRTGLLAGRHDVPVGQIPALTLGVDLPVLDPLHAVGALLHHAARPHRDFRIHGQLHQLVAGTRHTLGVVEIVETPHLVRAVVGTVPRTDAAVVDHVVQAFLAVDRRGDRADLFARRILAVMTRHRLMHRLGIVQLAAEVPVDAQPMHLASPADLLLAHDRHVVLRLAGNHAGVAADALVQVDGHPPGVALVIELGPQRLQGRSVGHVPGEVRMLLEMRQVGFTHQLAHPLPGLLQADRVDGVMILGRGQFVGLLAAADGDAGGEERGLAGS